MNSPTRIRKGAITLPIVDVGFLVLVLKDEKTKKSVVGVRRQMVDKVVQVLEEAMRDQVDAKVELDVSQIALILQVSAGTIEWLKDLLYFRFEDGDE